ncbi:Alpha/Beta hydrolase protein [Naematelia encephala]|uniref:Alpha/Beta hydrolase protein n=1 Tax=Naematelia encephala TaxID=71784 RepID=A0A1Y2BKK5_9TREE|nr:Alpha/Beta hydrolase protein [Naematelia encephala]
MSLCDIPFVSNKDGTSPKCDVFLPENATAANPAPVLVWWHGGGLLQGTRKGTAPHLQRAPEEHGLCVVSADYRLAPQSRLPDILSDVAALLSWLHSPAFAELTSFRASPSSGLVLSGSSAGGWLALLAGTGIGFQACSLPVPASPTAIIGLYPISDLGDPFWHTKQHPVSYMNRIISVSELETHGFLDPTAPKTTESELTGPRSIFYHYMVQEGILEDLLLGGTDLSQDSFAVAQSLRTGGYRAPPTFMMHGTIDDKVPIAQAEAVEAALREIGGQVELVKVVGADHLFDRDPASDLSRMYAFIRNVIPAM